MNKELVIVDVKSRIKRNLKDLKTEYTDDAYVRYCDYLDRAYGFGYISPVQYGIQQNKLDDIACEYLA